MPNYTFDRSTQRYRSGNSGRFIGQKTIDELTQKTIRMAEDVVLQLGDQLIDGKIALAEWQESTAIALKEMHTQQYLLGRGGLKMMGDRDYELATARLEEEFGYLHKFGQDMQSGMSVAQFEARLNLYLKNGRSTYQLARRRGHEQSGHEWERRRLRGTNHCPSCIDYAGKGWVAIMTLPGVGAACECRANCQCYFEYSVNQPDSLNGFSLGDRFGWIGEWYGMG